MLERRAEILAGARRAFTAHGYERATVALRERMQERQRAGEVRDDLDADVLLRFVGLVMDGAVLQIGAGLTFDVEPMVQLVRAALAPK
jgi:hypothetical protein